MNPIAAGRAFAQVLVLPAGLLLAASAPANAGVIILDNDVNISWSQIGPEACPELNLCPGPATIFGMPRLITDASGSGADVFFDVDTVGNAFASFSLVLRVATTDFEELVDLNNNPLRLIFTVGPSSNITMADFFSAPQFMDGQRTGVVRLQDFSNFNLLPTGTDLIFALGGTFEGKSVLAQGTEFGATVTVYGAGTELQAVPEPGTLVLLTSGLMAGFYGLRRRAARP